MKKILILLAALVLILSGCSKEYFKRRHQKRINEFLAGAEHNPALFGKWEYRRLDSNNTIYYLDTIYFKPDGTLITEAYYFDSNTHDHIVQHWRTKSTYRLEIIRQSTPSIYEGLTIDKSDFVVKGDTLSIVEEGYYIEGDVSGGAIYLRVK